MKLRTATVFDEAPVGAIKLSLFRCDKGVVRGWFVGPVLARCGEARIAYEPKSENLPVSLALTRAFDIASRHGLDVFIIDPRNLWHEEWRNG